VLIVAICLLLFVSLVSLCITLPLGCMAVLLKAICLLCIRDPGIVPWIAPSPLLQDLFILLFTASQTQALPQMPWPEVG